MTKPSKPLPKRLQFSMSRQRLPQQTEEQFVSANVSVAQYEAWSPEERFQFLTMPKKSMRIGLKAPSLLSIPTERLYLAVVYFISFHPSSIWILPLAGLKSSFIILMLENTF
jgi:hypothetical protein